MVFSRTCNRTCPSGIDTGRDEENIVRGEVYKITPFGFFVIADALDMHGIWGKRGQAGDGALGFLDGQGIVPFNIFSSHQHIVNGKVVTLGIN